jgi:tRNA (guanine37-N1)-methyltransferase
MVACIKVLKKDAQEAKRYLMEHNMMSNNFYVQKTENSIIFPVTQNYTGPYTRLEQELTPRQSPSQAIPFKDALAKILSNEELTLAKTAHEIVGDIAIIEVPEVLEHKSKEIGEVLLQSNPQIKTVLRKAGGHEGVFRTQYMIVLAGEQTTIATYRENNCWITYDLSEMYFSARLATERKRIYEQVKEGEDVLVMFSGAAPYCCVIAKNTQANSVTGVEINPSGHEFGLQNIKKNKLKNVTLQCGDVRNIVPQLKEMYDRIIMPLPKTAEEFLDVALSVAKTNCIIHLYGFYHEEEFDKAYAEIKKYCEKYERKYNILSTTKVGQQSPRTYRICVDFQVE